jgi:hypothetical protein
MRYEEHLIVWAPLVEQLSARDSAFRAELAAVDATLVYPDRSLLYLGEQAQAAGAVCAKRSSSAFPLTFNLMWRSLACWSRESFTLLLPASEQDKRGERDHLVVCPTSHSPEKESEHSIRALPVCVQTRTRMTYAAKVLTAAAVVRWRDWCNQRGRPIELFADLEYGPRGATFVVDVSATDQIGLNALVLLLLADNALAGALRQVDFG